MARSTEFQLASSLSKKWTTNSTNEIETLDTHLLTYLNLLDHYNACHDSLQSHIQAAFFNLSKAKVILGPSRVGPNSYDLTSRLPTKTISIQTPDPIGRDEDLDLLEIETKSPFVLTLNRYEDQQSTDTTNDLSGGSVESSLRKRKPTQEPVSPQPNLPLNKDETSRSDTLPEKDDQDSDRPRELPNPILQFAPLPPPPLRSAQIGFSKTLDSIVRLANLRSILIQLEQSIQAQKHLIENQSTSDLRNKHDLS